MDKVVLFDGVCNLCQASVQTLIKLDKKKRLKFASLQSNFGQELLSDLNIEQDNFKTFIYLSNKQIYTRSTAAIQVFSDFGGAWKLVRIFYIIPKFIRNAVYDFVSSNRYKWFGKKDACWIPTPELKARFLD